jgi:aquaporin NIP
MKMQAFWAELLGTYALVFFGTGAIIIDTLSNGDISHLGIAVAFGLVVTAMIYAFGSSSGAHINPAVSISFAIEKIGIKNRFVLLRYIIAQTIGGLLASGSLYLIFPDSPTMGQTNPSGVALQSFVLEFILTFFLMLVILLVSQKEETKAYTAIAIGGTVCLEALVAGPICGASMNPIRSLAPAILANDFEHIWIYILAPILGAVLAGITWRIFK